jgi:hypothetical protein
MSAMKANDRFSFGILSVVIGLLVAGYLGAYFACVRYDDVGDNAPLYIVNYRVGSHTATGLGGFFEPARLLDEAFISKRKGAVIY